MLEIRWSGPLEKVLSAQFESAEQKLEFSRLMRPLLVMREHPCIAQRVLAGIEQPPLQRIFQDTLHRGQTSTVIIASRGTSKTATTCVQYHSYKALLWPKRKSVVLSATGFRGGQIIFEDLERYAIGAWDNQEADVGLIENSLRGEKPIKRAQNFWSAEWTSLSTSLTVPTNDPEKLRGIRAHDLYIDEANFTDPELVDKVASSFLNVLKDWKTGGDASEANTVTYTTTVDYGWREFLTTAHAAYDGLRREMDALKAAYAGDWETYDSLAKKGLHRTGWITLDYTDSIMTRHITTRDGRRFEVTWPDPERQWKPDPQGIPYTKRDERGHMRREGDPEDVIHTYPINRVEVEGKLTSGETAEPIWLAEQRNVEDRAAGDVYAHTIVDTAVCKAGRYVLSWAECGPKWQAAYKNKERDYKPSAMWSCTDPCVMGVDYAPGSRDFCAFVVMRVGPLAEGEFDPITGLGHTNWSNVIWAEQHRGTSGDNAADKVRAFAERYNLVYFHNPYETDTWKAARAVGLDFRGGGNTVRDALVFINDETVPEGKYRIFDPLDPDPRVQAFKDDPDARPMLDSILPTNQLNDKLVEFTVAQMTAKLLYVAADLPMSERPLDAKYDVAYNAMRILEHQLRALQQAPTASGYRKFFMKGDEKNVTNKKDLWAAYIYAAKQLRAHLLRVRLIKDTPPPMGGVITKFGKHRGGHLAVGARRWG